MGQYWTQLLRECLPHGDALVLRRLPVSYNNLHCGFGVDRHSRPGYTVDESTSNIEQEWCQSSLFWVPRAIVGEFNVGVTR